VALGDIALPGVERAENGSGCVAGLPAGFELLGKGRIHGLAHEGTHAHPPAGCLAREPSVLIVRESDWDASHAGTIPHSLTQISVNGGGAAGVYPCAITSESPGDAYFAPSLDLE